MAKRDSSDKSKVVVRLPAPIRSHARSYEDELKVPFCSYVTPRARAALKALAKESGIPQVALVAEGLNLLFAKRGKPCVA